MKYIGSWNYKFLYKIKIIYSRKLIDLDNQNF
jgi:hypothetical protein